MLKFARHSDLDGRRRVTDQLDADDSRPHAFAHGLIVALILSLAVWLLLALVVLLTR